MNEKASVPSVPSSRMGLNARLERVTEITPEVIDRIRPRYCRNACAKDGQGKKETKRCVHGFPPSRRSMVLAQADADSKQPTKRVFVPNVLRRRGGSHPQKRGTGRVHRECHVPTGARPMDERLDSGHVLPFPAASPMRVKNMRLAETEACWVKSFRVGA
jgi:hypothetical protein